MKALLMAGLLALVAGCAAFEQTPADLQKKLSESTHGHLYERDPLQDY
ncbi:MAG TPA: hypothetical protein VL486_03885 [Verrucomicrobiae bacterium]|nr:hypothetical protein [Verrucomicrobiae bacterium]